MAIHPTNSCKCIFWSETSRRCTSNSDGLFIPTESHIIACCTTAQYVLCERYNRDQQLRIRAEKELNVNRRKHERTSVRYPVSLTYLNPGEKTSRDQSIMADTIDFSDGGLQIASRKPLLADTLVRIIYNRVASDVSLEELAQVQWCLYSENTVRYRAGLSFQSQATDRNSPL